MSTLTTVTVELWEPDHPSHHREAQPGIRESIWVTAATRTVPILDRTQVQAVFGQ